MVKVRSAAAMAIAAAARIGMWGFSRGGLVTYGVLARSSRVAAAVIQGGPSEVTGLN